jgi:hypothetical protein
MKQHSAEIKESMKTKRSDFEKLNHRIPGVIVFVLLHMNQQY